MHRLQALMQRVLPMTGGVTEWEPVDRNSLSVQVSTQRASLRIWAATT